MLEVRTLITIKNYFFIIIYLFLFVGVCPHNQQPSNCANGCGPRKCNPDETLCLTLCVKGCVCPVGTCANDRGVCVKNS